MSNELLLFSVLSAATFRLHRIHLIIHSKYFAVSNWLHSPCHFFITERKKCKNTQSILINECDQLPHKCLQEKTSVYILIPRREINQCVEKSLRGGTVCKLVDNSWMNNKAIIKFDFQMMWRIMQISRDVIHLGLQPWWMITSSSICIIVHILLTGIQ